MQHLPNFHVIKTKMSEIFQPLHPIPHSTEAIPILQKLSPTMPAAVRDRDPEMESTRSVKKARTENPIQIPSNEALAQHHQTYLKSTPYKHAVIGGLLSDELVSVSTLSYS